MPTSTWVDNSHAYFPALGSKLTVDLFYFEIGICSLILFHSWRYHKNRYTKSRIQTEIAAACGILMAAVELIAIAYNTPKTWAGLYDFLAGGFLTVVIQVMDNLMFYSRLRAVTPIGRRVGIGLVIYGVLFMYSWVPIYSIFPFFINVDGLQFLPALIALETCSGWASLAYNMCMVLSFSYVLFRLFSTDVVSSTMSQRRRKKVIAIAVLSILHGFLSSFGHFLWTYFFVIANPVCNIIIIVSMHFLFNIEIEEMWWGTKDTFGNNTSISGTDHVERQVICPCSKLLGSVAIVSDDEDFHSDGPKDHNANQQGPNRSSFGAIFPRVQQQRQQQQQSPAAVTGGVDQGQCVGGVGGSRVAKGGGKRTPSRDINKQQQVEVLQLQGYIGTADSNNTNTKNTRAEEQQQQQWSDKDKRNVAAAAGAAGIPTPRKNQVAP